MKSALPFGNYKLTNEMRYFVTNPKDGMEGADISAKFHADEPLLEVGVGETKEVSERAAKWLAYTYHFVAVSEVPDVPKKEVSVEKQERRVENKVVEKKKVLKR